MTRLDSSFERNLRQELMDQAEAELYGEPDNLAFQFLQQGNETLEAYGQRNEYDVEPVIESGQVDATSRTQNRVSVVVGWTHKAAGFMNFGTTRHTIKGNPILSFVWERRHDPPRWVRETFDAEGDGWRVFFREVTVDGLPAARYVQQGIQWFRLQVTGRVSR